ncbi:MAG: hypothetical protein WEE89_21420 [Gemmatimonadota bacterium]
MLLLTGCYSYKPVLAPQAGTEIRARLNSEAAVRRSQGFDEPVLWFDGRIVELSNDGIALDVLVMRSNTSFQSFEVRDTLRLENSEIASIMQRKFAAGRTALVTIGGAAAVFLLVKGIEQVVGGTGDEDGGGDPTFTLPIIAKWGVRFVPAIMRPLRK